MGDLKKIATRESFGKALLEINSPDVVVLDADLGTSTKTMDFGKKYPNRYIQNGISEADMIGTAAGIATCEKTAIVSTFAAFLAGRAYDQIRQSVAYANLNVKMFGTHSGITVGEDGATHQMLEDLTLMRVLPNMTVLSPADDISTRQLVKKAIEMKGPVYMRLSRQKTNAIYTQDAVFDIGGAMQIGEGKDATIFATGDILGEALKAQELLKSYNIDARVCDIYSIKPINEEFIIKQAKETAVLFSVEDHSIYGGLGSAIAEVLVKEHPKKLYMMGMTEFGRSGKPEELIENYNLGCVQITDFVKSKFIYE